ncbi:MAG: MoaD/ThiS family protein [Micrococcales bacterium]|nr:MoaD/ThiS family protein [Micrococcales bacterium]MCL2667434.1 MoaD/ThiS family protein [Micrococcales bacterium]
MSIQVRYFAAARDAAETPTDTTTASTVADLATTLQSLHPALVPLLPRCTILVDGERATSTTRLPADAQVDILPPFSGG